MPSVPVTVSFAATRYEASEDDEALEFLVRLSAESSEAVTVDYATASGTAEAGDDYEATIGTLTFPAGTTELTIRVPIIDDNVVEEEETFTIVLRNSNATIGDGEATGVITDNDERDGVETRTDTDVVTQIDTDVVKSDVTDLIAADDLRVVVSIAADLTAVVEGQTAVFTLTREGELTAPLTVPVQVTEHGAFLTDEVPTEATFAANAATATLLVATEDDGHAEANVR